MTITREQIADLNDGDMVTVTGWFGCTVTGPVHIYESSVQIGKTGIQLGFPNGAFDWTRAANATLTIVSRAEPPLYANHPRTKAHKGDIARDAKGNAWLREKDYWFSAQTINAWSDKQVHDRVPLTLLWDGKTGEVVK